MGRHSGGKGMTTLFPFVVGQVALLVQPDHAVQPDHNLTGTKMPSTTGLVQPDQYNWSSSVGPVDLVRFLKRAAKFTLNTIGKAAVQKTVFGLCILVVFLVLQ